MNLQVVGEIAALCEQHQVGKTEGSTDNLVTLLFGNAQFRRRIAKRYGLRGKRSFAGKRERISHILDVYSLG